MSKLLANYVADSELAAQLGVCRRTVQRWAESGELVETRLGGLRLIDIKASRNALAIRARALQSRRLAQAK